MSYIIWSRRCKKCNGQFYLEENEDGAYLICIQCGRSEIIEDEEMAALLSAVQPAGKKQLSAAKR